MHHLWGKVVDRETRPYDISPKRGLSSARRKDGSMRERQSTFHRNRQLHRQDYVKPHDNVSLFPVVFLSSNLNALYLQFLYQVITIYILSINFLTPWISIMLSLL